MVRSGTNTWLCAFVEKEIVTGGCGIWLSNITVKEVIEMDELNKGNISTAAGKKMNKGRLSLAVPH